MRNELLQERASRQDLECDKMALERQVHTLLSGGQQLHTVFLYKLSSKHTLLQFIHAFHHFHFNCIHPHILFSYFLYTHRYDCGLKTLQELVSLWPLQNKDLKSRVSHMEGSQKSNKEGLVVQLEERVQELEERLEGEERWGGGTTTGNKVLIEK